MIKKGFELLTKQNQKDEDNMFVRNDETVVLLPFNDSTSIPTILNPNKKEYPAKFLPSFADKLKFEKKSDPYTALVQAYSLAYKMKKNNPYDKYTIFMITDGKNKSSYRKYNYFIDHFNKNIDKYLGIKTVVIFVNHSKELKRMDVLKERDSLIKITNHTKGDYFQAITNKKDEEYIKSLKDARLFQ